jgi:DNA-binding HxlR family transcriptional regulator
MKTTRDRISYCSAARAIEVVGERWSLLIVRDLLAGPRRFSDLLHSVGAITPKLLTQRLRDLEERGVVERDEEAGRREVWYSLTPAGAALRPVVRELMVWGIDHAEPPRPGETVSSRRAAAGTAAVFIRRGFKPDRPVIWSIDVGDGASSSVRYDGERWEFAPETAISDLLITPTPEQWVAFLRAEPAERSRLARSIPVSGDPEQVARFLGAFGAA